MLIGGGGEMGWGADRREGGGVDSDLGGGGRAGC